MRAAAKERRAEGDEVAFGPSPWQQGKLRRRTWRESSCLTRTNIWSTDGFNKTVELMETDQFGFLNMIQIIYSVSASAC